MSVCQVLVIWIQSCYFIQKYDYQNTATILYLSEVE